jgi:hypothetical protein
MTNPDSPILPTDPQPQQHAPAPNSPARRRRARRAQLIPDAEGRAAIMATLAKRAYPNYEFFIFAVLSGAVLGLGYLLDSPAVLLLGILLAPLMTPWVGMVLAIITGSVRFFSETLVALLISAMLVFLSGLMSGLAARAFLPLTFNNAFTNSQIWWPGLAVLALGSILLVISFVRSEDRPFLPSVMLAYSFLTPISAAGFGLGSGVEGLWPAGALVFVVHLALASLLGMITFLVFRFRPSQLGWLMSLGAGIVIVAALVFLMSPGLGSRPEPVVVVPTQTQTVEPSPQVVIAPTSTASPKPTFTPRVQTATPFTPSPVALTLEVTLPATETATITLTVEPTPVYAKISSDTGGGVNLRKSPNGSYIATLDNGSVVVVLPEVQDVSGTLWAHVIATKNGRQLEGWILQSVLTTATPVPNWEPSSTPTTEDTPTSTETVDVTVTP